MAITDVPKTLIKYYLNRYPPQARLTQFNFLARWMWLGDILNEIKPDLFPPETKEAVAPEIVVPEAAIAPPGIQIPPSPYRFYRCHLGDPLNCNEPLAMLRHDIKAKYCRVCNFPAVLVEKTDVRGRKGTYRVNCCLGRRGMGRLYQAVQLGSDQPVVLKEFLLPQRYFNEEEKRQRQDAFATLAGFNLADGRSQDFRVMAPKEAIVDDLEERCYLITDIRDSCMTLNAYLAAMGAMSSAQVRLVLTQVLQSLEFLHQQKFSLPMGQVKTGLVHGNLNLDSLLVVRGRGTGERGTGTIAGNNGVLDPEFFIYLSDLWLWERLLEPGLLEMNGPTVATDLLTLGRIAFYLLVGKLTDASGQPLDPKEESHWVPTYPPLKQYILRLAGLSGTPFESAEVARKALIQLPPEPMSNAILLDSEVLQTRKRGFPRWLLILLAVLALALLAGILWAFLKPKPATNSRDPNLCCLKDVAAVPEGTYTYTGAQNGLWSHVLEQVNLPGIPQPDQTVAERFAAVQPKLQLNYQPSRSVEEAIARVQAGQVAFAIIPLLETPPIDLDYQEVAYDGLAVFVPFSYGEREQGLPTALNGQLTIAQIRQLYTSEIRNWQEVSRSRLPVRLYLPANPETLQLFEKRILGDEATVKAFLSRGASRVSVLPTFEMLRTIIRGFESDRSGGIGFAPFSEIFGQCSIYPMAIAADQKPPIQALTFEDQRPITPNTDLCDRKGSYRPQESLFRNGHYPLSYPIAVIYPRDNNLPPVGAKFAELLKTDEGQQLLTEAGLIPLNPLPPVDAKNTQPTPP